MWPWTSKKRSAPSVIGRGVRITGRIESTGDLTIYGRIDGEITHLGRLVIGEGAVCNGDICAEELSVAGEIHGNLQVEETLELQSTARVYGDTWCTTLQIQPGAVFTGKNEMIGAPPTPDVYARVAAPVAAPEASPAMAILLEPVGAAAREVLGAAASAPPPPRAEAPAFYGGFSPAAAMRTE